MQDKNLDLVRRFWKAMDKHEWSALHSFFGEDAIIIWPNTAEKFNTSRYVDINKNYPGIWNVELERLECGHESIISVTRIYSEFQPESLQGIAFFKISNGKIVQLTEYFADNHDVPLWRK